MCCLGAGDLKSLGAVRDGLVIAAREGQVLVPPELARELLAHVALSGFQRLAAPELDVKHMKPNLDQLCP